MNIRTLFFIISSVSIPALQLATNAGKIGTAVSYIISIPIVAIISFFAQKKYNLLEKVTSHSIKIKVLSLLYAIATAFLFGLNFIYILNSQIPNALNHTIRFCGVYIYPSILALLSIYALFIIYSYFFSFIFPILYKFIKSINKYEKIFIILSFIVFIPLVILENSYLNFSETCTLFNVDTLHQLYLYYPSPVPLGNSFAYIGHTQNTLQEFIIPIISQPLSVPITLVSFLIEVALGINVCTLLFKLFFGFCFIIFSAILFSRLLQLENFGNFLFCLIYLFSFSSILFIFFPEQYTTAVFAISILLIAIKYKYKYLHHIFWIAVGTLITNGILILFINYWENIKKRISLLWRGAIFVACITIIFGQLHITFHIPIEKTRYMSSEKTINLFFQSIESCFVKLDNTKSSKIEIETIDNLIAFDDVPSQNTTLGVSIFISALLGILLTRKLLISKICFIWIGLSIFILAICGYGAVEWCPTLYSYYFMWAYLIPIVLLINKILPRYIANPLMGVTAIALLAVNLYTFYSFYEIATKLLN